MTTNNKSMKWDAIDYCFATFFWILGLGVAALAILGVIAATNQGIIL